MSGIMRSGSASVTAQYECSVGVDRANKSGGAGTSRQRSRILPERAESKVLAK